MPGSARPTRAENRRLREENEQLRKEVADLAGEPIEMREFEVEPWIPGDAAEQLAKRLQELMIADNRATSGKAIERYATGLLESPITGWLPAEPPDDARPGDPQG